MEHQIFKGPYKVNPTLKEIDTPKHAFAFQSMNEKELPLTVNSWLVEKEEYKTTKEFLNPRSGLVSRPYGLKDSPDVEYIAAGVSTKDLYAAAIGTHGNIFFWGFAANPSYLTDEGKDVFANAIAYTSTLKDKKMIARRFDDRADVRLGVENLIRYSTREAYEEKLAGFESNYQREISVQKSARDKKAKGVSLSGYEARLLNAKIKKQELSWEDFLIDKMGEYHQEFKGDVNKFHKYLRSNMDYLFLLRDVNEKFIVDEDAKKLKIANNNIAILDKAISMLEKGKDPELAKRILDRYTLCTFEKTNEWREWFDTYKDKLFFTESGGWYFMVNSLEYGVEGNDYDAKPIKNAALNLELTTVSENEPVAIDSKLITLEGGRQAVIIRMNIIKNFHAYSNVAEEDGYIPVEFDYALPDGVNLGDIIYPIDKPYTDAGTTIYEGDIVFVQYLTGRAKKGQIKLKYTYQVCDEASCMPPCDGEINL